jgi:ElaB/YqjD/DUF883 family membrane-anchored ribosome-binding protein
MNRTDIDEHTQHASGHDERKRTRHAGHEAGATEKGKIEMTRLREAGKNLGVQLEEQVRKRPYVVIGAAAGVGFVAGSLFGSRLGQVLLAAGLGYVAKNVLEGDIGVERIQEGIERLAQEKERSRG